MKVFLTLFLFFWGVVALGESRNQLHSQEYLWDFSVSGGSSATAISLSSAVSNTVPAGAHPLPANAIVRNVSWKVLTTLVASTSASVSWGNTGDVNGYSGSEVLYTVLADNMISNTGMGAGALLWDDTNDTLIPFLAAGKADRDFSITFNDDVTAGKILFWVEYYMPSED